MAVYASRVPYDEKAARDLLVNAHAQKFANDYAAKRTAAAERLRALVMKAATDAGWTIVKDGQGEDVIEARPRTSNRVWLVADQEGIHVGDTFTGQNRSFGSAAIVYDAACDEWVGIDDDENRAVVPGELPRKRDALTVVAELVAAALIPKKPK